MLGRRLPRVGADLAQAASALARRTFTTMPSGSGLLLQAIVHDAISLHRIDAVEATPSAVPRSPRRTAVRSASRRLEQVAARSPAAPRRRSERIAAPQSALLRPLRNVGDEVARSLHELDVTLRGREEACRAEQLTDSTETATAVKAQYRPRTRTIHRLIRQARIPSAMTILTMDVKDPKRTPFTLKDLELFVKVLRNQSRQIGTNHRPPPGSRSIRSLKRLWRPPLLDANINPGDLPMSVQCMFAMVTVYETFDQLKIPVSSRIVAPLLATLRLHLSPSQMLLAAQTTLNALYASGGYRRFSHAILSSFILIFGQVGQPELGEQLLHRWALDWSNRLGTSSGSAMGVNMTHWSSNFVVWTSLVKARASAKDMRGARAWLEAFRAKGLPDASFDRPRIVAGSPHTPYLAYMTGLLQENKRDENYLTPLYFLNEVKRVIALMLHDRIPICDELITLVLRSLLGPAQFTPDLREVILLLGKIEPEGPKMLFNRPAMLQQLMRLRVAAAEHEISDSLDEVHVPSTRQLIADMVKLYKHGQKTKHRGLLNDALTACLIDRDYPAAILVLHAFKLFSIAPSNYTRSVVFSNLIRHRHQIDLPRHRHVPSAECGLDQTLLALSPSAPKLDDQQKEARLDYWRQSHARGDISMTTWSYSPGPTDRRELVNLLKMACVTEVERATNDPKQAAEQPHWVPKPADRPRSASQMASLALRSARYDFVRGTVGGTRKARLALVPRLRSRAWPTKYLRPVTGVAKLEEGAPSSRPTGPSSKELSMKAKDVARKPDDLEPVRVQYVPGFVPYQLGLALQEHLVSERADARAMLRATAITSAGVASGHHKIEPSQSQVALRKIANQDTLLLLQHRPVYTEGRRQKVQDLTSSNLRALGADYSLTKRGGQITYHGPGQLVGYPILNLRDMNMSSNCYVDNVQETLKAMLAEQGISTVEPPHMHTGVWTDEYHKIASIGIQVRHRVTSHGFALNIEPRSMRGFAHIVACGIVGRSMTCLAEQTSLSVSVPNAAELVTRHFAETFRRKTRLATPDEFQFTMAPEDAASLMAGLQIPITDGEQVITRIVVDGKRIT